MTDLVFPRRRVSKFEIASGRSLRLLSGRLFFIPSDHAGSGEAPAETRNPHPPPILPQYQSPCRRRQFQILSPVSPPTAPPLSWIRRRSGRKRRSSRDRRAPRWSHIVCAAWQRGLIENWWVGRYHQSIVSFSLDYYSMHQSCEWRLFL